MTVSLSCQCGALTGQVTDTALKSGTRLICHCRDCRAFQVALGRPDPGAAAGVDIIQLPPSGLTLTGEMAAMRLSPRGPFRFYAPCCGAPIATTMTRRTVPFAGLLTSMIVEANRLPKVRAWVNITGADGTVKHKRAGRAVRALFANAAGACLRGERTLTPFFDAKTGAPMAEPEVIDKTRKAEIYRAL